MEVIINDKTFTLLPLNKERRDLFCQIVCNPPKLREENQKRYLHALRQSEEKNWFKKIFKPKTYAKEKKWLKSYIKKKEKEVIEPMKEYAQGVLKTLWAFLKADDKKEIGTIAKLKLNIKNEDLEKWQKEVVAEIERTIKYFAEKKEDIKTTNEKDTVEAFLILSGHNREDVRNMNPIDLYEAIEGAKLDKERARVVALNDRALANTYAKGSKDSLNAINRINNNFKQNSTKPIKMTSDQERKLKKIHLKAVINQIHGNG
jgi:hypothetical protein